WDAQTGMELGRLEGRASSILAAALSPDGRYIATGSESLTSQLWDLSTGEVIKRFGTASGSVQAVAFSPDGRLIANARKEAVLLWDRDKGFQRLLEGHRSTVRSVAFSPDGKYLVTGSGDGSMDSTVRL